jgi:hypothetical protein
MKQNHSYSALVVKAFFIFFTANVLLSSCDFTKRLDTAAAVKELHEREVKRITPSQFIAQVDEWGSIIVKKLNANLVENLQDSLVMDSLSKVYRVEILSGSPLKLKNTAWDKKINETLDAYQYNVIHQLPQVENIQKSEDETFFYYTAPIRATQQLKTLTKKQLETLGSQAHLDSLSFRKEGDFIGLWLIKFSKKDVVRLADPKHLKELNEKQ